MACDSDLSPISLKVAFQHSERKRDRERPLYKLEYLLCLQERQCSSLSNACGLQTLLGVALRTESGVVPYNYWMLLQNKIIYLPTHYFLPSFQTVALLQVSSSFLLSVSHGLCSLLKDQRPHVFSLPPTVSYQQGVLSATILYEILLGKATLYALLVSTLVLMAMVRSGQGGQV